MRYSRAHKLDDDDRINIQAGIYKGYTVAAIAQHLHVHRSTITRELQRNSKHELDTIPTCSKLAKRYICNNCAMKFHCRYHHVYYDHVYANQRAQQQLRLSRSHAYFSESIIRQCFAICLCDNGSEFSSFTQLECNDQGEPLLHCFFTNPNTATDKARCERNHELARYCFTKHHSLNSVTQQQVDEAFSNINSYVRESKNDRTPYDLMKDQYGQAFLDALQVRRIPNKKVKLLPVV